MPNDFAILADGLPRPVSADTVKELLGRLDRMGLVRRDLETGEIVERSASAQLAEDIRHAIARGDRVFEPTDADAGGLLAALYSWLDETVVSEFPEDAMVLRYSLHSQLNPPAGPGA